MKCKLLISSALTLFVFTHAYAELPPKPEHCPGVEAITSIGVGDIVETEHDRWLVGVKSNLYDTPQEWGFIMGEFKAANESEALEMAKSALPSLKFEEGPVSFFNSWICSYNADNGYQAITVTPADVSGLKKLLRKKV